MLYYLNRFAAIGLILAGGIVLGTTGLHPAFQVTPENARFGWAGPDIAAEAREESGLPVFQLVDEAGNPIVQDNELANVRLWDAVRKHNNGNHTLNYAQKIGDCVSFGSKNAGEFLQFQAIEDYFYQKKMGLSPRGPPPVFKPLATYYIYGYSRVIVGKGRLGNSDGSVGSWAAKAVMDGGLLPLDAPGAVPYSGQTAKEFGVKGPPKALIEIAQRNKIGATAEIKSAADARDAICNHYPVTVASMFGTSTIRAQDGRMVAKRDNQWAHQMCAVAYDGSGPKKYFYIVNSWGETSHPAPMQGEPPGGFWVTWDDMDWICRTGDCWAYSQFETFKAMDLDFRIVAGSASNAAMEGASIMQGWLGMLDANTGIWAAMVLLLAGCALLALGNGLPHGRRGKGGGPKWGVLAAVMLSVLLPISVQAQSPTLDFRTEVQSQTQPQGFALDFRAGATQPKPANPTTVSQGTPVALMFDQPLCLDARPYLRVYGNPIDCQPCAALERDIKAAGGKEQLPFQTVFIKDPRWYPVIVAEAIAKSGRPALYYTKDGTGYLLHGYHTVEQLKGMLADAAAPVPAFDFKQPPVAMR